MKLIINTDGASRGNPGPSAIGVIVANEKGEILKKYGETIGEATNNEAEYQAVIFALKKVKLLFGKEEAEKMELEIRLDSELVAKQLNHEYKIVEENIQKLFLKIWNLMLDFGPIKFVSIPREQNSDADRLANLSLDSEQQKML